MNAVFTPPLYTPEDLDRMPDGDRYELVDGVLKERPVSQLSAWVASEIGAILRNHCRSTKQGWVFTSDASYQCFPDRPRSLRKPDVSVVLRNRLPQGPGSGNFLIAPDLAVEVISPNDEYEEVDAKIGDYLGVGVPLVWIVCPNNRTVTIIRGDGSSTRLQGDREIPGDPVLPGFNCPLRDFFLELQPAATEASQGTA